MKKSQFLFSIVVLTAMAVYALSCTNRSKQTNEEKVSAAEKPEDAVKRGEYLVSVIGCDHCHSPKRMGAKGPEIIPELMLSGYPSDRPVVKFDSKLIKEGFAMFYPDLTAAAGPWGVSFAGNLTPDETGIGSWTEDQFRKAITERKYKGLDGERSLLPPMPSFNKMSNDDIHSIFSYLKSIKAVKNMVPPPVAPDKM